VPEVTRRLAAVAFADVAGWSRLIEKNDVDTLRAWKALRAGLIEPKIAEHGGRLLELAGDSVLVEFPSAVAAVSWALEVQLGAIDPAKTDDFHGLSMRIGVNVEDVIVDDDKLVGSGVNVASRIHQLAAPGEIVVTAAVREYISNKLPLSFSDLGTPKLKHISKPVRIYRVDMPSTGAPVQAPREELEGATARALLVIDTASGGEKELQPIVDGVLSAAGAGKVNRLPHGWVADFSRAQDAANAAFEIQHACAEALAGPMPRMALQMTDVGSQESYGRGIDLATRLAALAGPGEIVASAAVRDELVPVLDADIEDLGECYIKPLQRPVRAYRLGPPGPQPVIESAAATELRPTIAVIPFSARTGGHEVLGEVLADEVICALSRSSELNVISRLSTTAFRGREATIQQIGERLSTTYVLSGAYRVAHGQFTLAVELAEAKSGRALWAREVKERVAGLMDGKQDLVDRIVAEASAAVIARELELARSQSLPTLESYTLLIGAIALMHRLSLRDFDRAREMLQALIERTQRLAVPQAWLAKWHVLRVQQGWSGDPNADARSALEWSKRALDADSHCSLALAVDGFVHTNLLKRLDIAKERYDLALSVNPNDALAWLLHGMLHAFKGEGKPAVEGTQRALRLSPLDPHRYFFDSLAASAALSAGDYGGAIELARRSMRANRTHTSTYRVMAISQWQLGQHAEAKETVSELMRLEPALTVSKWLERSPSSAYEIGRMCAHALREAGVPR
jgi:class 3 adenylate cyclase/Tfp pilus assembly protein PilF